ncbi:MAG: proteasome subunit alpha [Actinobacteria bacterium]|nr:proteasome subunit alpha [Actinomycetota bacterium]
MSMPYYVSPEQMMQDRADYARKGIARGRSLIALQYDQGIVLVAENPSSTLRKISEIYDRIAFAGVGKYSEFDQLRVAGVRAADLKGYQFSRQDVDARSLANQYAQLIATTFTHEVKPLEIEILVVEVGASQEGDRLYRIMYDGTVLDEDRNLSGSAWGSSRVLMIGRLRVVAELDESQMCSERCAIEKIGPRAVWSTCPAPAKI